MLKKNRSICTALFLLSAGMQTAHAQLITTAVPFLRIEPDSRIAGMGNAGVAVADNAAAFFWNPAALAFQRKTEFSFTHANWLPNFSADLFYDYLAGTYHLEGLGTFGANITYLNLGAQERTNETGEVLGTFSSYDIAIGGSLGIPISPTFSVGFGARFIYSNLAPGLDVGGQETRAGRSVGFDVAALYRSKPFLLVDRKAYVRAGFNVSNIGPGIEYTDVAQKDPLPTVMRLGGAFTTNLDADGYNSLTVAVDISHLKAQRDTTTGKAYTWFESLTKTWGPFTYYDNNGQERVTLSFGQQLMYGTGIEYWYNDRFALRMGYFYEHPRNGAREYYTFGAGLRINRFGIDYSYIQANDSSPLANQMRFSILYAL